METKSWVITDNSTGKAVFETFNKGVVDKINTNKYRAIPILEYLVSFNKEATNV